MEDKIKQENFNPHADSFQFHEGDYARVVGINAVQASMAAGLRVIIPEDLLRCCGQVVKILSVKRLSDLHSQYEVEFWDRKYHIQGIFLFPYSQWPRNLKWNMMRTIKFRGYNPKNKKWIYGHYFVNHGQHFIVQDELAPPQATREDYEVESETIGQYIGLNDKNGTEIYEGDIMRHPDSGNEGFIMWHERLCHFQCTWVNLPIKAADIWCITNDGYEVVGNVYKKEGI